MKFIADFHIHSHYSRATSKDMNVAALNKWAQIKGVQLIGTGDFTHPKWFAEMREKLEPAEGSLYRLKDEYAGEVMREVPRSCRVEMRYVPSVEVSTIYKKNEKVRKVHSIILAPSLEVAAKISAKLQTIGNLHSDGRPILGLDAKELLSITLDASPDTLFIPAHIWTPHFAVYGSHSGFDSLEECFDELAPYIFAVETGLSSDPAMNWRIPELDSRAIVSNSDAHSAKKLGREANVFDTELSYDAVARALKTNSKTEFVETIEFYPEEGKYHLDGHRECGTRLAPEETKENGGLCPKCKRPVTIGVMHRVDAMAKRPEGYAPEQKRPFRNIIPLAEILSECLHVGVASKRVDEKYWAMVDQIGNEFYILLDAPLADIEKTAGPLIAEAIRRMRDKEVAIAAGYDGEYGTVHIMDDEHKKAVESRQQKGLF